MDTQAALIVSGGVFVHDGDYDRAETLFDEALALAQAFADPRQAAMAAGVALGNLGDVARGQGCLDLAAARYELSLARYREMGDAWGEVSALRDLGDVARDRGDYGQAVAWYRQCLNQAWSTGDGHAVGPALAGVAGAAAAWGMGTAAARLFGAADAVSERAGIAVPPPVDRVAVERGVAACRALLGEDAFAATRQAGRAMSEQDLRDAVAAVSGGGG